MTTLLFSSLAFFLFLQIRTPKLTVSYCNSGCWKTKQKQAADVRDKNPGDARLYLSWELLWRERRKETISFPQQWTPSTRPPSLMIILFTFHSAMLNQNHNSPHLTSHQQNLRKLKVSAGSQEDFTLQTNILETFGLGSSVIFTPSKTVTVSTMKQARPHSWSTYVFSLQ